MPFINILFITIQYGKRKMIQGIMIWDFATYISCGSICLAIAVCLLSIRVVSNVQIPVYKHARKMLAFSALINVLIDAVTVVMLLKGHDHFLLCQFYTPVLFYIQFYLTRMSILSLLHSQWIRDARRFFFLGIILFICLAYVGCMLFSGYTFTAQSYLLFLQTPIAQWLTTVLYAVISTSVVIVSCGMWHETQVFRHKLESYFANRQVTKGLHINLIVYFFIIYFVLATYNYFFVSDTGTCVVLTWSSTILFIILVIIVSNLQTLCTQISVGIAFLDNENIADKEQAEAASPYIRHAAEKASSASGTAPAAKPGVAMDNGSAIVDTTPNPSDIAVKIEEWSSLPQKLYMHEGITLNSVANDIGVHARLLSHYINNVYHINFNSWINRLRIHEVCHILETDQDITMSELALKAGFTDASAMTKVFKREVGVTPTVYRMQHAAS